VRRPAPPYAGEAPHALWHVSENPSIERFAPHVSATAASSEPRVWAVDTRHLPFYWFPRQCPRGTFWATPDTTPDDAALLRGFPRVHVVESEWLESMRSTEVFAYRLPDAAFTRDPEVGGYWLSRESVQPIEVVALGDLIAQHEEAGIDLRDVTNLWPIWDRVAGSTLEYSGMRLHNASPRPV
jgi:hypothetical protein